MSRPLQPYSTDDVIKMFREGQQPDMALIEMEFRLKNFEEQIKELKSTEKQLRQKLNEEYKWYTASEHSMPIPVIFRSDDESMSDDEYPSRKFYNVRIQYAFIGKVVKKRIRRK
jgi:hypothetical protein